VTREDESWFLEVVLRTVLAAVAAVLLWLLALWCVVRHPGLTACSTTALAATAIVARIALRGADLSRLPSS
jgi:hypothetical protein